MTIATNIAEANASLQTSVAKLNEWLYGPASGTGSVVDFGDGLTVRTPARIAADDLSAVVMSIGSVSAPGMPFGSDATTGFYRSGAASASRTAAIGYAASGLKVMEVFAWDVQAELDGVVLGIGRPNQVFTNTGEHYLASLYAPACEGSGADVSVFGANLFGLQFTALDTVTKINFMCGMEFDKVDLFADAGPVTFLRAAGARLRLPLAHDDVTISANFGLVFTIPYTGDVQGTITDSYLVHFPDIIDGFSAPSDYVSLLFGVGYEAHLQGISDLIYDCAGGQAHIFNDGGVTVGTINSVGFSGAVRTPASTTASSGLRIPHGTAPTSPFDGEMWTTTAGLFVRINGVTKTVTLT